MASLVLAPLGGGPIIGPLLAINFGSVAGREIARSKGQQTGAGMAYRGTAPGWVSLVLSIFATVLFVVAVINSPR